jgi:hypothetical protein
MAVARLELTPAIPIFASIADSAANAADKTAYIIQLSFIII